MDPWTVDAWIAFLDVFASILRAVAWPLFSVAFVLIFEDSIRDLLKRIRSISRSGAELDPVEQTTERGPDAIEQIRLQNFGDVENNLGPWLERIRQQIQNAGDIPTSELINQLTLAVAYSERRADFLDIWRQIFGSQVHLLYRLAEARRLNSESIWDVYKLHQSRVALEPMSIDNWVSFVTFFNLADGDRNELHATVYGVDFVRFCRELELNPDSLPY